MLLEGRVPESDAECCSAATRARPRVPGPRRIMSELAFSGLGLNPAYGGNTDPAPATATPM